MRDNFRSWEYANSAVAQEVKEKYSTVESLTNRALLPEEMIQSINAQDHSRALHPFCSFGVESLYLSEKIGAEVIGVDFSQEAIIVADELAERLNSKCTFVRSDYAKYIENTEEEFDFIFTTLGSLWWIEDIKEYFIKCAQKIRLNGSMFIWDFHPIIHCINDFQEIYRSYPNGTEIHAHDCGISDYQRIKYESPAPKETYNNTSFVTDYRHSLQIILQSALFSGFQINNFVEMSDTGIEKYFEWQCRRDDGVWVAGDQMKTIPLTFLLDLKLLVYK